MAPPKIYTKEQIFERALEIVAREGMRSLTARNLARRLKSSIVPIYAHFKSMSQLKQDVIVRGMEILKGYMEKAYTDDIASNMGIGIVLFARDYSNLFKVLYMEGRYRAMREEFDLYVRQRLYATPYFRNMAEADFDDLFLKLIMFLEGYCALVCTGEVEDTSVEAISRHVNEACDPVIYQAIFKTDFTGLLRKFV